ncbi:Vacuolar protein sorting-associated protein 13C [Oopsacas minuta]|uniref:Vacuolar protein sorting-associated protein 13C n=1 Tax=Oopsacas minuta TaxID=111878 RepID=A0AAV7JXW7_9METZ|nr:Vacuolar protein sorting-associated protein 13C [Oopsacas minuta]
MKITDLLCKLHNAYADLGLFFLVQLLADIIIEKIGILITKEEQEKEIPQLLLELKNGVIHMKQRTWDLILNSELGVLKMLDLTTFKPGTRNEPLALISSEYDNKVFSVEVCIAERQSPEYHTHFNSTHKTVRLVTYPMHFGLHKNSLFNVTSLLVSLLPSVESTKTSNLATQTVASVNQIDDAMEGNLGYKPSFWGRDNEKGLHLELQMYPASLTLYNNTGPFIKAEFLGIQSSITLQRLRMDLEFIIQGYLISDLNPETNYPKLLYQVDPTVPFLQLKMNVFKEATLNDKYLDLQQKDLYVEVKLARNRLILLADLIAQVVPFFTQLAQINFTQNTLIDSAKDAATVTAKETAAAAKSSSSSRIGLNILIEAPSVLIPLHCKSKDVFIIDVGNFNAMNSFHFASEIYGSPEDPNDTWKTDHGHPAVIDKMKVAFSDLQINRCHSYEQCEINSVDSNKKFSILQPVNVDLFLDRTLNECLANIPKNNLSINIDIISLHIKPQDLVNLAFIVKSLGLVQASLDISNARKHVNSQQSVDQPQKPTNHDTPVTPAIETSKNIFVASAKLETVKITVYSEEDSFADIFLTHLSVNAEVKPPISKLHAVIRGFGIRDLTPNSIYPEILSTNSTTMNLIELQFETCQDATKGENFFNLANSDGKLTLTIGKIKFYLIYSFMNHILHTLLQFKVSRKTVEALKKQAKKQAANTATSTVDRITQTDAKRFLIAVKVEAPVIVVPVSSESNEGLVLDLGLITVNNAFSIEKPQFSKDKVYNYALDISNQKIIFDNIDLTISSIQLYRQTAHSLTPTTSDPILQSFELELSLIRTIPFNKYDKPQMLIYLSLSPIIMEFHLIDYKTILSIIQSNIKSGKVLSLPIDETDADSPDEQELESSIKDTKSKPIELPNIAFYLHLDGYTLSIIARDQEISTLILKSFDIEVKSIESMLSVTGELGELKLTQPQSTHYSNIISLAPGSEHLICFNLTFTPNLPHDSTLHSFNKEYDLELNVDVGEVEVVILYSYISKMINFATNFSPKRTPKSDDVELPEEYDPTPPDERILKSIASLDKFAMMKQRLKININFRAPVIYIPQNSVANQVIVARLGNITLQTEPTIKHIPDTKEEILTDCYQLTFSKLTISRGFINISNDNYLQSLISMRPLTSKFCLEVSLLRRVTPSTKSPFLLVQLHLHEISLLLGSLDLEMITDVIIGQIKDQDTTLISNDSDFSFSLSTTPLDKPEVKRKPKVETRRLTRMGSVSQPHIFKSDPETALLSVNLQIDSIGLKIFHMEKNIPNALKEMGDLNEFPIPQEKSLAYLAIVNASLVGEVKPNLVTGINLTLNDIVVQDNRVEMADKISRMISRSILVKDERPLLAIELKRLSSDDLTMRLFLCNLTAIFSTEFLITIALFFWKPIERVSQITNEGQEKAKRRKKTKEIPRNTPTDLQNRIPTFRLNITVKNPTVLLIENTTDRNPRTLVGKLELSGIVKHDKGLGFSTTFTLSNAQLYTCLYNTIANPYSYVVAPFVMHMNINGIAEEIHIVMESLQINLTPSTLALVTHIAESLKFPDKHDLGYAPIDLWEAHDTEKYSWFLRSSESIDSWSVVLDNIEDSSTPALKTERLDIEVRSIDFKLDSEYKGKITPIMLIHASAGAEIQNWKTQVEMLASFTVEASYFNEKLSTWEPLLEPAQSRTTANLIPFRFKLEMNTSDKGSTSDVVLISDSDIQTQAIQAEYAIELTALDGINITVSRELIEILSKYKDEIDLVKSNVKSWDSTASTDESGNSVFVILNELSIPIKITLDEKDILFFDHKETSKSRTINDNTPCHIYTSNAVEDLAQAILSKRGKVKDHYMHVSLEKYHTIPFIPIHRTGNLLYFLPPTKDHFLVVEINLINGYKQVIIRSPMKIRNELDVIMEIFASPIDQDASGLTSVATIQPKETYYVPLHHTYNNIFSLAPHQLIYRPSMLRFGSHTKFSAQTTECMVHTDSSVSPKEDPPFSFTLDATEDHYTREPLKFKRNSDGNYPHHIFTAYVPSIIHNLLPVVLNYEVEHSRFKSRVLPGSTSNILFYSPDKSTSVILTITLYETVFQGKFSQLSDNETSSCKMQSQDGKLSFILGVYAETTGSLQIKVFAAYWVINKTGLNLQYKSSESGFNKPLNHESTDEPMLFPSTSLGSKVKLAVRRLTFGSTSTEWSNSVAIGAVGSENLVESNIPGGSGVSYQFGIRITVSSSSLTKIVIITPYNLLINNTKQELTIQEQLVDSVLLKPGDCTPFYPIEDTCKIVPDTSVKGAVLDIAIPGQILLQFDGDNPAIPVDISTNVSSNVITFQSYYDGAVPLQIVNSLSEVLIEFKQKGCTGKSNLVPPGTSLNYTWEDPSKPHEVEWWPTKQEKVKTTASVNFDADGKVNFPFGLDMSIVVEGSTHSSSTHDDFDDISTEASMLMSSTKSKTITNIRGAELLWISFLDGLQRILLITNNSVIARHAKQVQKREKINFSFAMLVEEIGISLIDAITRTEIAYITLVSSDTVWQYLKNGRIWKTMSGEIIKKLESAYTLDPNSNIASNELKVDFQSMQILEPYSGHLRRTHFPGLSLELQISSSQLYFDIKIASIQVDNQMAHILYPIVFHSVALPTDALNFDPKPFLEASLILLLNKKMVNSMNIRYFKVLVQEMSFNLDIGFIEGVIGLFGDLEQREWTTKELFEYDYKKVRFNIYLLNCIQSNSDTISFLKSTYSHFLQRVYIE